MRSDFSKPPLQFIWLPQEFYDCMHGVVSLVVVSAIQFPVGLSLAMFVEQFQEGARTFLHFWHIARVDPSRDDLVGIWAPLGLVGTNQGSV